MILYNTLMGVCAGLIMIIIADYVRRRSRGADEQYAEGPLGIALLVLGVPLTVLSGAMTLTWPLTVNPPINIAFAEPCLLLGLLAIAGGITLIRLGDLDVLNLRPIRWVVFTLGLVLAATASAILSYDLVGDAPPQEPITGQFTGWENAFFFWAYATAAAGCLLAPWINLRRWTYATATAVLCWLLAGGAFLLFSVINYRTHIGLLVNLERGTNYRW